MSQENVELVRSIYAPWERGDFSPAGWEHPEIEITIVGGPGTSTSTGRAAAAKTLREFLDAWERVRFAADEYRELDGERVLVLDRAGGRGKTSALDLGEIHANGAHLFHVGGGQVTRVIRYWDRDRALADLGLAE